MSFIFMAFHEPKPEHRQDLLHGMTEMRALMAQHPGFIDAGAWEEAGTSRIVGIAVWESQEAFEAAMPPGFGAPSGEISPWETAPRVPFFLTRWEPRPQG
jgi:hypothetical protein